MAASVGEIGLDLVVNRNGFDRQMRGITGLAKKAAAALAGAFAIGKLVDFGKQCLELGSDLAEVQNVVDVTFPAMSAQVNDFAKKAATAFGLSETMAKRYTGTFGAMAKAFGFSEQAAYEMGTTLTGLAGDVASFYNISQDEAYTKLKAVFTGETEVLKDLGIVMTQNALDAYAMANGYGKVTAKMTEAEKVALRYKFVQDQLALATGDFARTSDGWANQVRILKLQFDSLKATLGQGLINLFTPIIKGVNVLLGKLTTLANAFKSFTELLTGKKSSGMSSPVSDLSGSASDASQGLTDAAGSAGNLADNTSGVGKAAKKAAKEMKALMGFDDVNKLDDTSDSDSDGSGGGTAGGSGAAAGIQVDYGNLAEGETVLDALSNKFKPLIDRAKELADLFKQGFVIGFGDSAAKIDSIKTHINSIGQSLKEIFTDNEVVVAANRLFDAIALNAGKITGALASVGLTIADNLVGGIDKYLQDSKEYIKTRIVSIFDVSADIADLAGDFAAVFADIFDVFRGDAAKGCTEHIIGIFADAFLGTLDLGLKFGRDILGCIVDPIIANKDKIKEALEYTLSPLESVLGTLHGWVKDTFTKIHQVYDEYLAPAFENISSGFTTIMSEALNAYNTYLAPVLDWIAERFAILMSDYIQPLTDAFLDLFGKAAEALSIFWDFISPFVAWFVEKFIAVIAAKIQWLWTKFEFVFSTISALLQGFCEFCSGVIDFIVGVFTGDWEKAWNGVKECFKGICTAINGVFEAVKNFIINCFNTIKSIISNVLDLIKRIVTTALNAIKTVFVNVFNALKGLVTGSMSTIKSGISSALEAIKNTFSSIFEVIGDTVSNIFGGIWDTIRGVINCILGGVESMVNGVINGVNSIAKAFNSLNVDVPDWVPGLGGKSLGFNLPTFSHISLPRLAQGGYVKPNTPQLAMIGDNRHQGEVVAPEDKLLDMALQAAKLAGNGTSPEVITLLKEILLFLRNRDVVTIDEESLRKYFIKKTNKNTKATGRCELVT